MKTAIKKRSFIVGRDCFHSSVGVLDDKKSSCTSQSTCLRGLQRQKETTQDDIKKIHFDNCHKSIILIKS